MRRYYRAQISDLSAPLQGKGIADCNTFVMYAEILALLKRRETNRERFSPRSLISLAAETGKKQREERESMPKCGKQRNKRALQLRECAFAVIGRG